MSKSAYNDHMDITLPRLASYRVAEASTAHVTDKDRIIIEGLLLEAADSPLSIRDHEYGWLILVHKLHLDSARLEQLRLRGVSDAFLSLLTDASHQGARWLDLDIDAETYRDRPAHTW